MDQVIAFKREEKILGDLILRRLVAWGLAYSLGMGRLRGLVQAAKAHACSFLGRRSVGLEFGAEVGMSPSLVARVIRGKREEPAPFQVAVDDSISVADEYIFRVPGDTTDGIRVGNDRRSAGDDLYADGTVQFSMHGKPAQGEELSLPVCNILREYLNRSADVWGEAVKPVGQERGVDGELRHRVSGAVLKIQVVRAETSRELCRTVAQQGSAAGTTLADTLADALRSAIYHKRTRAYRDIVLALDATETSRFAFSPVVASFRRRHGGWAAQVGFKEIWVVGSVPDLVERLDIPAA